VLDYLFSSHLKHRFGFVWFLSQLPHLKQAVHIVSVSANPQVTAGVQLPLGPSALLWVRPLSFTYDNKV